MRAALRTHVAQVVHRVGRADEARAARVGLSRARDRGRRGVLLATAPRSLRALAASASDLELSTFGSPDVASRAVVVRRRDDPRTIAAIDRHDATVRHCLDAADIVYRSFPITSVNRRRVSVLDEDRDRVLRALQQHAPPSTYLYIDDATLPRRHRLRRVATISRRDRRHLARADVWRVFEFLADATGRDILGDLHGCEIEFWRAGERPGEVAAPRWNPHVTVLPQPRFARDTGPMAAVATPTLSDVDFPVDLVYTWVDGADPAWRRRRDAALGLDPEPTHHHEAASDARYTSYDELRYSLRSVERYADFVNHVYLVTADQRPGWLVDDHPRLTVVDHRAIFDDPRHLPTFNSHAIESRLHHVPGLAEHYVYMNDDFLFGRRVTAATFFHANGLAKFFPSRALVPTGAPDARTKPVDAAAINGRDLLVRKFGRAPTRKMQHAPYPQLRSVHVELETLFPDEVAATSASRVRSPSDLSMASFLHHHVAFLTGRAVPDQIANQYVDLGRPDLEARLEVLRRRRNYDSLCLNDTDSDEVTADRKRAVVRDFLQACFPEASSFERA